MKLKILGSQGALPKRGLYSSSQVLNIKNKYILIDCPEGIQFQLKNYRVKFSKIDFILISHAHGDHYFGLMGLISTYSLLRRTNKLTIFCPKVVSEIINSQMKISSIFLYYDLEIISLNSKDSEKIYESNDFTIVTIPLKHSIYCNGFLISEKNNKRKLNLDLAKKLNINKVYFNKLTKGENVFNEMGREIDFRDVTSKVLNRSYAYCSDTIYFPNIIEKITHIDLLYHESTFLEKDKKKAKLTMHSTAMDAAKIASKAQVSKLLIGHFSSRYENLDLFINEVKQRFQNVELAFDGKEINI
ncbi:MAG: ribonuclease [Bacteroidetes bacterium MED-G13]|nr:MAG: ribonuclease [Bacteroidetes bacterium MED-G13]